MSLLEIYWRALGYLGSQKRKVILICGANIALAIVAIAEPLLFGRIIDAISQKDDVAQTMAAWVGLGIFNIIAFVLVARSADRMAHSTRARVLSQSFEKVITMPLAWHHQHGTSNSLHTLIRAVDALFGLWLEFMRQHLSTAVALVLLVPTAFTLDPAMSVVLLVLGAVYVAVDRAVMKKTKQGQASVEKQYHRVFAHVSDSVSNVSVLQSYNRIAEETRALEKYTQDLLKAQFPVLDWWALACGLHRLAATISMMIVLSIGALFVMQGKLRIGDVVAFTGFATLLIGRLDQITSFVNQIFEASAKLEDFYHLEDAVAKNRETDSQRDIGCVKGHVRFNNVTFSFPNSAIGVKNISFDVPAGKTVAIVGPTGAGKTTLINLLQRVYEPDAGQILIDDVDTRTVSRHSLRHCIATVFQDAGLFNRSIEENIRIGRSDASYDDIHAAAIAADAQDFILSKSEGYDTQVGERGGQLSGGERQRIAIARAILKGAPILVLDEATSALDVETEARIKEAIDRLRANRTTFIIAHRLSTVRDADLIIFLDKGRIIEMGSFGDLSASNGRFAGLLRAGGLLTDAEVRRVAHIAVHEAAA